MLTCNRQNIDRFLYRVTAYLHATAPIFFVFPPELAAPRPAHKDGNKIFFMAFLALQVSGDEESRIFVVVDTCRVE